MQQVGIKNTSTTLSRRSALAIVGASSASLAVGVLAATSATDTKLIELGQRFSAARKAVMVALTRQHDITAAYHARALPYPEVCRPRPTDADGLNISNDKWNVSDGLYRHTAISSIRDLKAEYTANKVSDDDGDKIVIQRVLKKTDVARRDEIVKAYDGWKAHDDTISRETGYDHVDEILSDAMDIEQVIAHEIMETPASGIAGLKVKALLAIADSDEACGHDTGELIREGRQEPVDEASLEDMFYHLAWDILEMSDKTVGA